MQQTTEHQAALLADAGAAVTLLAIFDQRSAPTGRVRFKAVLAHLETRLAALPLRRKLLKLPLHLDRPYWVDDETFDLENHVRHIALPQPGDWRQLCIQAARIHARPLDAQRPLWEAYVIEGLDSLTDLPAGSFALLLKVHPAVLDLRHEDVLATLLNPGPPVAAPWFAEPAPALLPLAARGALRRLTSPRRLMAPLSRRLGRLAQAGEWMLAAAGLPLLRFNAVVSPHRVFESRRFELAEIEKMRRRVRGATVNDVVLALCGDALRRYLMTHDELPQPAEGVCALLHAEGQTPMRVDLFIDEADPLQRLRLIRALTAGAAAKALPRAPSACQLVELPAVPAGASLCGARLRYVSALLPVSDGAGLVLALSRCEGLLIVSPTACRELMPDPERFAQALRDSFEALRAPAATPQRSVVSRRKAA